MNPFLSVLWISNLEVKAYSVYERCIWGTLVLHFITSSATIVLSKAVLCNLDIKYWWIIVSSGVDYTSSTDHCKVLNLWNQNLQSSVGLIYKCCYLLTWKFCIYFIFTDTFKHTYCTHYVYHFGLIAYWIYLKMQKKIQCLFYVYVPDILF